MKSFTRSCSLLVLLILGVSHCEANKLTLHKHLPHVNLSGHHTAARQGVKRCGTVATDVEGMSASPGGGVFFSGGGTGGVLSTTVSSNVGKRIITGVVLSVIAIPLCLLGKEMFSVALAMLLIQALREFHDIISSTEGLQSVGFGVGVLSTLGVCVTSCCCAQLHEYVAPLSMLFLLLQRLFIAEYITPTADLAVSSFGTLYISYLMSFWIRLMRIKDINFANFVGAKLGSINVMSSSILLLWTFAIIASADVGGYLIGKPYGRHKILNSGLAVGKVSPNKTLEGVLGGVVFAVMTSLLGVLFLRPEILLHSSRDTYKLGYAFSVLYGTGLALTAFSSDVSVSLFKRNAGVKDSGRILPGHGGVLDRVDSFILTAPLVYLFWSTFPLMFT